MSLIPPAAATFRSRTVSSCPPGHDAGLLDWLIGRFTTKVSPHWRQRNSYAGTRERYVAFVLLGPLHMGCLILGDPQGGDWTELNRL